MTGLGLDLNALYQQGVDFLMKQAADWARIPTRLNRAAAALTIVQTAAAQRGDASTLATMSATKDALVRARSMYDSGSSKVADVVDQVRALPVGSIPPLSLAPKAAEVAAIVAAVTGQVTQVEQQIAASSQRVLTPDEQAKLNTGISFPTFMGNQAKAVIKYILIGGGIYLAVRALSKSGGTRSW